MSIGINLKDPLSVTVGINPFFTETAKTELFPKWFSNEELVREVMVSFDFGHYKRGYRDGVLLVSLNPKGWKTRVVQLQDGMEISGSYKSRVKGETPRKQTGVWVESADLLPDAKCVEVVLYSRETLEEKDEARTGCEFDVITVLAHPCVGGAPMSPGTLMANHFGADGGSNTLMSAEEFEVALKASFEFWSNKAIAQVGQSPLELIKQLVVATDMGAHGCRMCGAMALEEDPIDHESDCTIKTFCCV